MSDDFNPWSAVVLAVIAMGGFVFGFAYAECKIHDQAIKHGAAQYNATTGKFEWKQQPQD